MLGGMYAITFTLFAIETQCLWKAAGLGLVSATLKSVYSLAHAAYWRRRSRLTKYSRNSR